jgi:hypothetical protein
MAQLPPRPRPHRWCRQGRWGKRRRYACRRDKAPHCSGRRPFQSREFGCTGTTLHGGALGLRYTPTTQARSPAHASLTPSRGRVVKRSVLHAANWASPWWEEVERGDIVVHKVGLGYPHQLFQWVILW